MAPFQHFVDVLAPFYYILFYTPSAIVGAAIGVAALMILKKAGALRRLMEELEN